MQGSSVVPSMRYKDAPAAIAWLCDVLGFEKKAVYDGPDGTVAHAELSFGQSGMVMLGSATNPSPYARLNATPAEIGGRSTSPLYLVVTDCEPVYARVKKAGAEIVMDLQTMDYGGKAFSLLDPEGYHWSFGEYDPWKS